MTPLTPTVYLGATPYRQPEQPVSGEYVTLLDDVFYQIRNYDAMRPFFMTLVSSSDHWLFISSTGGLSAGRGHADQAIFPYYTEDRLTENSDNTGSKTILRVTRDERTYLWEPFSTRQQGIYRIERHLYKNIAGTALIFEETNLDLKLRCRYAWRTSDAYGFVKTTWVHNLADAACHVEALDGLQNLLPANSTVGVQNAFSVLLDAYKRSELDAATGLGIFALNATLSDMPEPSESLLATTVAPVGAPNAGYLLSATQLDDFRAGKPITTETEIRGGRCAYFIHTAFDLGAGAGCDWHMIADGRQDSAAIIARIAWLKGDPADLRAAVEADIAANQRKLESIVASADGAQRSADSRYDAFHFANVMFNVMRGGIPADQYTVRAADFVRFVTRRNRTVAQIHAELLAALPAELPLWELQERLAAARSADLLRLSYSFLPLVFSRRHGDPSRPWNRFAIDLRHADGTPKLHYEGNWRDIFQNWEALAYSYPEFVETMASLFLNSTTPDGYNPYRITHDGIDWEVPEPHNPWSNIGYWSDHQIIYLLMLMEISVKAHPGKLRGFLNQPVFSYANVPYRIRPYSAIIDNAYQTISFDFELHEQIEARSRAIGADGKLVTNADGRVVYGTLAEKLLTLLLAKLANFVPEGGIWMNTQRPEWNDANNALVGKGLSVVTLGYLRRYLVFCRDLIAEGGDLTLAREVEGHFRQTAAILREFQAHLVGSFTDAQRRRVMDALGEAGSAYRQHYYAHGFSGVTATVAAADLVAFFDLALAYVEHTLRANRRLDDLYHAYNILHLTDGHAAVGYLYEMLEGQVSILASGMLCAEESLALLRGLRQSALYRADQHTYLLYPDRQLPGFLAKNALTAAQIAALPLLAALARDGDSSLIVADNHGGYHFHGEIRNFRDVQRRLDDLPPQYAALIDRDQLHALFEATFRHSEFTGRSGTFFAYEGLGSVYWHMVAKLLLVTQETALRFRHESVAGALRECYADIRRGLSFNKSPAEYGAFPSDAYSHTPKGQGAKQPGMTGFVKEVILSRQNELGYTLADGKVVFDPALFDPAELLRAPGELTYQDVHGATRTIALAAGTLAYTVCQTPVIVSLAERASLIVALTDGTEIEIDGATLDEPYATQLFRRGGTIRELRARYKRHPSISDKAYE